MLRAFSVTSPFVRSALALSLILTLLVIPVQSFGACSAGTCATDGSTNCGPVGAPISSNLVDKGAPGLNKIEPEAAKVDKPSESAGPTTGGKSEPRIDNEGKAHAPATPDGEVAGPATGGPGGGPRVTGRRDPRGRIIVVGPPGPAGPITTGGDNCEGQECGPQANGRIRKCGDPSQKCKVLAPRRCKCFGPPPTPTPTPYGLIGGGVGSLFTGGVALPPPPAGWDWVQENKPGELWLYSKYSSPTELIAFFADGTRAKYREYAANDFYLITSWDPFDNQTDYLRDPASGLIQFILRGRVVESYIWTASATGNKLDIDTYVFPNAAATVPTLVPFMRRSYEFSIDMSRLLRYSAPATSYLEQPSSSASLYDLSQVTTDRMSREFTYEQKQVGGVTQWLLSGESYTRGSWSENRYSISYALSSSGQWRANTVTDELGNQKQVSITPNDSAGVTVTLQSVIGQEVYVLDSCGRRVEVSISPAADPRAGDTAGPSTPQSLSRRYTYAFNWCRSFQISHYTDSSGFWWDADYDLDTGALLSSSFPNATGSTAAGSSTTTLNYSYGSFFDGTPLQSVTRDGVVVDQRTVSLIPRAHTWDPGRKPQEIETTSRTITAIDGTTHTIRHGLVYQADGKIRLASMNQRVGSEYVYDDDPSISGGTGRGLIVKTYTGPLTASGDAVDRGSPDTTVSELVRGGTGFAGILGYIAATIKDSGPHQLRIDYGYDAYGRVNRIAGARGAGPAMELLFDYDRRGFLAVTRTLNLDRTGQRPADLAGARSNQQYLRADTITGVAGRPVAQHIYAGATFAQFTGTSPSPDLFDSTYVEYGSPLGLPTRVVDKIGESRITYDGYGFVYKRDTVAGGRIVPGPRSFIDAAGLKVQVVPIGFDAQGQQTFGRYEYFRHLNGSGIAYRIQAPDGVRFDYTYNSLGSLIDTSIFRGSSLLKRSAFETDEIGRVKKSLTFDPLNGGSQIVSKVKYNEFSLPEWQEDHSGQRMDYSYDGALRQVAISGGGMVQSEERFPGSSRIHITRFSNGLHAPFETEYVYNGLGEVVRSIARGAGGILPPVTVDSQYDSLGRVEWMQDSEGLTREISTGMDGFTWWTREGTTDPISVKMNRTFNPISKEVMISTIGAGGEIAESVYGPFGELRSSRSPGEKPTTYSYNNILQLVGMSRPDGTIIKLSYDSLGRPLSQKWIPRTVGVAPITQTVLQRNAFGGVSVLEQVDGNGLTRQEFDYDQYMNISAERTILPGSQPRVVSYDRIDPASGVYDPQGRIFRTTIDGITWRSHFNAEGRVEKTELENPPAQNIPQYPLQLYHQGAVPIAYDLGNGLTTSLTYDDYGLLSSLVTQDGGVTVDQTHYVRDREGRVLVKNHPGSDGFGDRHSYDEHGRVTEWKTGLTSPLDLTAPFSQAQSNRHGIMSFLPQSSYRSGLAVTGDTPQLQSYTTDRRRGVVTDISTTSLTYDPAGRMVRVASAPTDLSYIYDAMGKLSRVVDSQSSQTIQSLQYDPMGRLVRTVDQNGSRILRWAGERRLAEEDQAGLKKIFVHYPGQVDEVVATYERIGPNNWKGAYMTHQAEGPAALFDSNRAKLESYRYNREMLPIATRQSDLSQRVGSHYGNDVLGHDMMFHEASNLYYARARWYNPQVGLFTSRDPIMNAAEPGHSFNHEDPINFRDPLGLQPHNVNDQQSCTACHIPPEAASERFPKIERVNYFANMLDQAGRPDLASTARDLGRDAINPRTCMDCHVYLAPGEFRSIMIYGLYPELHQAAERGKDIAMFVAVLGGPVTAVAGIATNGISTGLNDGAEAASARVLGDTLAAGGGWVAGKALGWGASQVPNLVLRAGGNETGRAIALAIALRCGPACETTTASSMLAGAGLTGGAQYTLSQSFAHGFRPGKFTEDMLRQMMMSFHGAENVAFQAAIPTAKGLRVSDVLVKDFLNVECKEGFTCLSARVRAEISKDVILRDSLGIQSMWVFSRSPVTGRLGASRPLLKRLQDEGFSIFEYDICGGGLKPFTR